MVVEYQDERLRRSKWAVIRWFRLDRLQPERAVTSYWVSSKALLFIRIPLALYSTVVMWASIGTSAQEGDFQRYFTHFTQMTYIGLHAYFIVTYLYYSYMLLYIQQTNKGKEKEKNVVNKKRRIINKPALIYFI